jgi:deubiquitinating protein VCIP135
LQDAIHKELGIAPADQKIRFGFPPRLLQAPQEGKEQEPIPIQHGDRVRVEVLPPPEPVPQAQADVEMPEEKKMDVAGAMGGEVLEDPEKPLEEKKQDTPMDGELKQKHFTIWKK